MVSAIGWAQNQPLDTTEVYARFRSANDNYYYGYFDKALAEARLAKDQIHALDPPHIDKQIKANMLLAKCYIFAEIVDSALLTLHEAEDILLAQDALDTFLLAQVYGVLSHANERASKINEAMQYGKKGLFWGQAMNPDHSQLGDFYHSVANVYFSIGDYETSYEYYQRAVDFYLLTKPADHPSVLETRMAKVYTQILNLDTENAYREIDDIIRGCGDKPENKTTLMAVHSIKGAGLYGEDRYEESLVEVNKSLELIADIFGFDNAFAADIMQTKARLLADLGRPSEAEAMYDLAAEKCEKSLGRQSDLMAAILADRAKLFRELGRYDEAYIAYDESLKSLNYSNPASVLEVAYFKELLIALAGRNQTHLSLYESNNDPRALTTNDFDEAIALIEKVRSIYIHEGSKQRLVSSFYSIYENAIRRKFIQYEQDANNEHLEIAFGLMEKAKVQTLLDQLRQADQVTAGKIDEAVAFRLDSLERAMGQVRQQMYQSAYVDDSINRGNQSQYLDLRKSYEEIVSNIRKDNPEYYQFNFNQEVKKASELREDLLDDQTALIEYFLGEDHLMAIVLTKEAIYPVNKNLSGELAEYIQSFTEEIVDFESHSDSTMASLSDILLEDILNTLPQQVSNLIIIPDGQLSYVPFELLNGPNGLYLIHTYNLSYASSATLLQYQHRITPNAALAFAGFAPDYDAYAPEAADTLYDPALAVLVRSGNMHLPAAIEEVEQIANMMGGDRYTEEEASEAAFKEAAGKYDILHLAMHSLVNTANPSFSRLLFDMSPSEGQDDGQLLVEELYGMNLEARLAVLSACNTGFGKVKKGEGTMSIARAFTYAGVPSTLMSLWEVPDKSTAMIMIEFYNQLKKGKTKDRALREAKLAYLNDPTITEDLKRPFYWAGFIAMGNMEPLMRAGSAKYIAIGISTLLFLIFIWRWLNKGMKPND